ncbi:glycosyltransferase family 2 protein [Aeromonas sp. ASNIH2]|uniref:glycosyltransferase family 2 protein n=1 Tax=Aeromonas sp. ASNIH2 TaxID=1636607 RepID=UPI001315A089|nr:glycosyltransferase family 2 protein [Aeromonas sp. ASNIH2]
MSKYYIDIVLATYNGALFIKEQLDSIRNCDGYNELINRIIVSDDSSVDDTVKIVHEFNDSKIEVVTNTFNKGPVGNFSHGLSISTAQFVMFSDQDDVWCKDKILKFYEKSKFLDVNHPGVVYSNLTLVDKHLNLLGRNFFENEKVSFDWGCKVSNLFFQNVAPGCAMLLNRKCIERIYPLDDEKIVMHDWWALMFASIHENVLVINEPLVQYRQHENNAVGATIESNFSDFYKKIKKSWANFHRAIYQLEFFYSKLSQYEIEKLNCNEFERITFFKNFNQKNIIQRICAACDKPPYKSDKLRDALTRLFIILG